MTQQPNNVDDTFLTMADEGRYPTVSETPKKRKILGRKRDQDRDKRLCSLKQGPPCHCKRLKCFEVTTQEERLNLIDRFNALKSKNEQDAMLASLITISKVKQRRPRTNKENGNQFHDHSYAYELNIVRDGKSTAIPVCFNAFISIFGTTKAVVERIRKSVAETGETFYFNSRSNNKINLVNP